MLRWELYGYDGDEVVCTAELHEDSEITQLVVNSKYRRQGYAESMVASLETLAESLGHSRVFATVDQTNEPSNRLWKKRKYKKYNKFERVF